MWLVLQACAAVEVRTRVLHSPQSSAELDLCPPTQRGQLHASVVLSAFVARVFTSKEISSLHGGRRAGGRGIRQAGHTRWLPTMGGLHCLHRHGWASGLAGPLAPPGRASWLPVPAFAAGAAAKVGSWPGKPPGC